ncbi:MAG TPA: TadE family type IV pilus minor pilin [Jatrophihabitans sp.]|nr:TadE family type IV pilus minor pilin [Jatrophihabitans sp.]
MTTSGRRVAGDAGMVTVETALVLPLLMIFALTAVAMIGVAVVSLRCADLARESARAAARGQVGPPAGSAAVTLSRRGEVERATVRRTVRPAGWLPALTIVESATAALEPAADAP